MKKYNNKWLEDFLIRSTWTTNKIEGNKLTLNQTKSIIINNTIPVRANKFTEIYLKDVKEVENGVRAFDAMFLILEKQWPVNEELIKTFHHEITKNLINNSGQWKTFENQIGGAQFNTVEVKEVSQAMKSLIRWYNEEIIQNNNLLEILTDFHIKFEMIHPFEDGNGRTGRLLLNYQLMSFGYFPVVFSSKKEYIDFLSEASEGITNWKEAKAPKDFVKLINELSEYEKKRNNIFKNEKEMRLTQEYYNKSPENSKNDKDEKEEKKKDDPELEMS